MNSSWTEEKNDNGVRGDWAVRTIWRTNKNNESYFKKLGIDVDRACVIIPVYCNIIILINYILYLTNQRFLNFSENGAIYRIKFSRAARLYEHPEEHE